MASKPPRLRGGDLVGVAALSSAPDPAALARGLAQLEAMGLAIRPASNLHMEQSGFAGSESARLAGFHELVAADEVKAILFARGGHGLLRILPDLDWELMASHRKAYVGYSDLTPLLNELVRRLDLICFHGPMVATELARPLSGAERSSLLPALEGRLERHLSCSIEGAREAVEGPLLGGCISMLTAVVGTPYSPDLKGSILFLEDINEPLYRLDRMLTHLQLSGTLDGVKAMVLGHLEAVDSSGDAALTRARLCLPGEAGPAALAWGVQSGHGTPNLTLPLGARARLEPTSSELIVLEP